MEGLPTLISLFKREKREQITVECASRTQEKERYPKRNEDTILIDEIHRTFGVLDGMGGLILGHIASQTARDSILELLSKIKDGLDITTAEIILQEIMEQANTAVREKSKREQKENGALYADMDEEKIWMGTTATVFKIHTDQNGRNWGMIAHAGDSRLYKISKDGKVKQITTDDARLKMNEFGLSKEILEGISKKLERFKTIDELSEIEKYYFKFGNNIGSWLGSGQKLPDIQTIPIEKGDRFIIVSDGIYKNLTPEEFEKIVKKSNSKENTINELISEATIFSKKPKEEEARACRDDMSAVFIEIK